MNRRQLLRFALAAVAGLAVSSVGAASVARILDADFARKPLWPGVKTPETSKLFVRYVDPTSGVVSYLLRPGLIEDSHRQLYFTSKSMTEDGRFLVVNCACNEYAAFDVFRPRRELKFAGSRLAVVDMLTETVHRLYDISGQIPFLDVDNDELFYARFDAIRLEFCDRVRVDGVTIRDSLIYHFRPIGCRDVTVENVKVIGSWRYNADGFDMHNCERVVIRDSFVRTYDDAICVKGFDCWMDESEMLHDGYLHDTFRDVLVTNCVTWCDWGKNFEIGAETRAREICNVTFRDCDAIRTSSAPCDVYNVDWADVHDIVYEDIRVEYDDERLAPLYQKSDDMKYADRKNGRHQGALLAVAVQYHPEYSSGGTRRGRNRRILFKDIRVTGDALPVSYFVGCDANHRTSDITVDGVYLNGRRVVSEKGAKFGYGKFADPVEFR